MERLTVGCASAHPEGVKSGKGIAVIASMPTASVWSRWQIFFDVVNDMSTTAVQPLLANALRALVTGWSARGGAIRYTRPGEPPMGVRVGQLPLAVQRVIARHLFSSAHLTVQQYPVGDGSLLLAPLRMYEFTVGGLYLWCPDPDQVPEDLLFAARALQAAVERVIMVSELRRDLRELGLVTNISHGLNTRLEVRTVLQELIVDARTLLNAQAVSVLLVDESRQELVFELSDGTRKQPSYMRMPIDKGIAGAVVRSGEPVLIDDAYADPRFFPDIDLRTGMRTRSIVAVPLQGRDRVIGVLEAINRRDGHVFTDHDLELVSILVSQAAVAIENARLYEELRAERDRLVRREAEVRARIGRDLHDGPVQQVAAAGMHVNLMRKMIQRAPDQLPTALDDLDEQLKQATHDLRTVLYELRPLGIEEEGLYVVLGRYVAKFRDPNGLHVHLDVPPDLRRLPPVREAPTLIIVQEAVNNVRKHAHAHDVYVTLRDVDDQLVVQVRDNGRGFDVAALEAGYVRRGSFGLLNMRERAELIGGACTIESVIGEGTTVTLRIPFS